MPTPSLKASGVTDLKLGGSILPSIDGPARQHRGLPMLFSPRSELPCLLKVECGGFEVVDRLGAGSFGEVWRGVSAVTHKEVAMKFEPVKNRHHLILEAEILATLCQNSVPQGFAQCFNLSQEGPFLCLVMDKLGHSLKDRVTSSGGKLSLQTTTLIAEQVLQRVEYLHSKCLIHRDIKPENFMFGIGDKRHHVYLIDFGLSKAYWTQNAEGKRCHIPFKSGYRRGGTARYVSMNAHNGLEQSRRDDLESIGYMLLHCLTGALPWSHFDTMAPGYTDKVALTKESTPLSELCEGAPMEFARYIAYCRNLGFTERPDYTMLFNLVHSNRNSQTKDHDYEWLTWTDAPSADLDFDPAQLESLRPRANLSQPDDYVPRKRNSLSGLLSLFHRSSNSKVAPHH